MHAVSPTPQTATTPVDPATSPISASVPVGAQVSKPTGSSATPVSPSSSRTAKAQSAASRKLSAAASVPSAVSSPSWSSWWFSFETFLRDDSALARAILPVELLFVLLVTVFSNQGIPVGGAGKHDFVAKDFGAALVLCVGGGVFGGLCWGAQWIRPFLASSAFLQPITHPGAHLLLETSLYLLRLALSSAFWLLELLAGCFGVSIFFCATWTVVSLTVVACLPKHLDGYELLDLVSLIVVLLGKHFLLAYLPTPFVSFLRTVYFVLPSVSLVLLVAGVVLSSLHACPPMKAVAEIAFFEARVAELERWHAEKKIKREAELAKGLEKLMEKTAAVAKCD
ncbi:hypothetical protein JCM8547_009212 [Rhodosporidiobolus lusitaniae]